MNDIVISNLCVAFGEKKVLNEFNLTVKASTRVCITGESGSGKTTLLNVILGFVQPSSGSVKGVPEKLSAVFQEDRLCEEFNSLANLSLVTGKKKILRERKAMLASLGLEDSISKPVHELSGGMKRRVAVARALLSDFDLLLMDEPTRGLDEANREKVLAIISQVSLGKTVICVTHDASDAEALGAELISL